eukprot:TRINITY_DN8284_c0_g1_i1.p1 TRINITY_DN8284_c0_g1~~TRINITY_DN8284_c0_g1_i1.p1  ORF type:complete len:675 (-),score=82.66 TRINITY_DN8284_c0_g1_i1:189-2213(-)
MAVAREDFPREALGVFMVIGLGIVCVVIYGVRVVRTLVVIFSWENLRAAVASMKSESFRNVLRLCTPWSDSSQKLDAFERKVRELAEVQRITRCKKASAYFTHIFAAVTVGLFLANGYTDLEKFTDAALAREALHQSSFVTNVLCLAMTLGICMFDKHVGAFAFDAFQCLFISRMIWQAVTSSDVEELLAREAANTTGRMMLAAFVSKPVSTGTLNALCTLVKVWKYFALVASSHSSETESVAPPSRIAAAQIIGGQLFIGLGAYLVASLVQFWNHSRERSSLEAQKAAAGEVTIKALLAVMSDAVVVVTQNLLFTTPCMQLAHFLIRQPLCSGYLGCSLLDFMDKHDGETFRQQIADAAMGPGTTLSIATRLVDGAGRHLDVQMYCVAFLNWDDNRGYAIGIQETRDSQELGLGRLDVFQTQQTHNNGIQAFQGPSTLRSISESGGSSHGSASVAAESTLVPVLAETEAAEMLVDIGQSMIPILHASPGLVHMVGPLVSGQSTLSDCVGQETMWKLWSLVQDFLERVPEPEEEVLLGRFPVQPSHAVRAGIQYEADVSARVTEEPDDEDTIQVPVRISLQNVSKKTSRRRMSRSAAGSANRSAARHTSVDSVEETGIEETAVEQTDVEDTGIEFTYFEATGVEGMGVDTRVVDDTQLVSGSAAARKVLKSIQL